MEIGLEHSSDIWMFVHNGKTSYNNDTLQQTYQAYGSALTFSDKIPFLGKLPGDIPLTVLVAVNYLEAQG